LYVVRVQEGLLPGDDLVVSLKFGVEDWKAADLGIQASSSWNHFGRAPVKDWEPAASWPIGAFVNSLTIQGGNVGSRQEWEFAPGFC